MVERVVGQLGEPPECQRDIDRGRRPFEWQDGDVEWARSPEPEERVTRTYCGT